MNIKNKKVSKTHQNELINRMNKLGYTREQQLELLNDDFLFAGKSKNQSVNFEGTHMTIHKPTLPFRPRGNKNTKKNYTNVVTTSMTQARQAWDIRTKDIYEDIVREFSFEHNLDSK